MELGQENGARSECPYAYLYVHLLALGMISLHISVCVHLCVGTCMSQDVSGTIPAGDHLSVHLCSCV